MALKGSPARMAKQSDEQLAYAIGTADQGLALP